MTSTAKIQSYLTPMEVELARARLAEAGIVSSLESAELLTWLWYYSSAFRGAALRVLEADRDRALEILAPPQDSEAHPPQPRECAACGESLPGDWLVCWRCDTDADGTKDEAFFVDECEKSQLMQFLRGYQFYPFLLLFLAATFFVMPAVALVLIVLLPVYAWTGELELRLATCEPEENAALPALPSTADTGDELCRRAMASAMFGIGWFFPLTLYSIWLLVEAHGVPVGANGRLWRRAAWALNVVYLVAVFTTIASLLLIPNGWESTVAILE